MSHKPKILIAVFTGPERCYWINPSLAMQLLQASHSFKFDVSVECVFGKRPVDFARNYAVAQARDKFSDWLLMLDNDQSFTRDPLEILAAAGDKQIIGLPSIMISLSEKQGKPVLIPNMAGALGVDGRFLEVTHIGTGGLFVHRAIWETIPGPWFRTVPCDDELLTLKTSEDWFFCDRVREHGFKVWIHGDHGLLHYHTLELAALAVERNGAAKA